MCACIHVFSPTSTLKWMKAASGRGRSRRTAPPATAWTVRLQISSLWRLLCFKKMWVRTCVPVCSWEQVSLDVHTVGSHHPSLFPVMGAGSEYQAVPQQPSLHINSTMIHSVVLSRPPNLPKPWGEFRGTERVERVNLDSSQASIPVKKRQESHDSGH